MSDLIGIITTEQTLSGSTSIAKGLSAYELAVQNGFEGTLEQWIESLKGVDGIDGINGINGINGKDGKDGMSVFIKYSDIMPTQNQDMKDEIGDWIGICKSVFEPTSYLEYQWYCMNNLFPINEFLDYGNVSAHKTDYNAGGPHGYMTVFIPNMVKIIENKVCLDCFFSDFEYPDATRENHIVVPSIAGRKYLFRASVYGKTVIRLRNINNGNAIETVTTDNPSWQHVYILATSTGDNLYFSLNSVYINWDEGFVSELMLIDLSRLGDENFTLSELELKYGDSLRYFNSDLYLKGDAGISTYESAQLGGFSGTETEFYSYLSRIGTLFE